MNGYAIGESRRGSFLRPATALPILAFVVGVGLFMLMLSRLRLDIPIDDAPITYRYAMNLAQGNGFVYNLGERVLGTSTPLYTLLLGVLARLGVLPQSASLVIGIASFLATLLVAFLIAETVFRGSGFLAVVLVGTSGFLAVHAVNGMETSLYCLLIFSSLLATMKRKIDLAFVLAGLTVLLRLDGLVVFLALSLTIIIVERRLPWRGWLLFLLVILPWLVFSTWYFGSPVPLSLLAKRTHPIPERFWMLKFFFYDRRVVYGLLAALTLPLLLHVPAKHSLSSNIVVPVWFGGYVAAYALARIEQYDWYLSPIYVTLFLLAGIGLWWLAVTLWQAQRWWAVPALAVIVVLLVGMTRNASLGEITATRQDQETVGAAAKDVGKWLKGHTASDAVIGTSHIGHIGYESGRTIYDFAGLVTPAVVAAAQEQSTATYEPEYLVVTNQASPKPIYRPVYRSEPSYFVVYRKQGQ